MNRRAPQNPLAFLCAYAGPRRRHAAATPAAAASCALAPPSHPPLAAPVVLSSSSPPPQNPGHSSHLSQTTPSRPVQARASARSHRPRRNPPAFLSAGPRRAAAVLTAAACCFLAPPFRPPPAAAAALSSAPTPAIFDTSFRLAPRPAQTWALRAPQPAAALEQRPVICGATALLCGAAIGWERRTSRSILGVRVCALVALGTSLFFSIAVSHSASDSGLGRAVGSAATAVAFLGKEIFQLSQRRDKDSQSRRTGLTTAATIWLAAASGIAASAGLILTAVTCALATVLIARYLRMNDSLEFLGPDDDVDDEDVDSASEGLF